MIKLLKFMNLSLILSMDSVYKNHKADVSQKWFPKRKFIILFPEGEASNRLSSGTSEQLRKRQRKKLSQTST